MYSTIPLFPREAAWYEWWGMADTYPYMYLKIPAVPALFSAPVIVKKVSHGSYRTPPITRIIRMKGFVSNHTLAAFLHGFLHWDTTETTTDRGQLWLEAMVSVLYYNMYVRISGVQLRIYTYIIHTSLHKAKFEVGWWMMMIMMTKWIYRFSGFCCAISPMLCYAPELDTWSWEYGMTVRKGGSQVRDKMFITHAFSLWIFNWTQY